MSWDADEEKAFVIVIEDARGWPMLALGSFTVDTYYWLRTPGGQVITSGLILDSTFMPGEPWDLRVAPLRPIWPGFLVNTTFYALLLWLLFFAPFTARCMLRRRRGQCEKCAYPIGTSEVCTECGAAVQRRREVDA